MKWKPNYKKDGSWYEGSWECPNGCHIGENGVEVNMSRKGRPSLFKKQ